MQVPATRSRKSGADFARQDAGVALQGWTVAKDAHKSVLYYRPPATNMELSDKLQLQEYFRDNMGGIEVPSFFNFRLEDAPEAFEQHLVDVTPEEGGRQNQSLSCVQRSKSDSSQRHLGRTSSRTPPRDGRRGVVSIHTHTCGTVLRVILTE